MLSLKVPAGTTNLAVAYVCPSSLLTQQWVFELSTTDGTSFTLSCWQSLSPPQSGTLTGSVDAGAVAGVSQLEIDAFNGGYIGRFASVVTPVDAFSLSTESGNNRVDVLAYDTQQTGTTTERSLLAVKDFSSQLVPGALNGGNAVVLGASDETTSQPIIFANAPAGFSPPSASVTYVLGSGGGYSVASNAVNHYPVIPAGASEAGDYYDFLSVIGDSKGTFVGSEVATNSPGAVTMTFPVARF
jgi:hypothetical protein